MKLPARTIRLRLTAIYGIVFLISSAVLLTIGYELVRHNLIGQGNYRSELRKLGLLPPNTPPPIRPPGTLYFRFGAAVRDQLRAALDLVVQVARRGGGRRRIVAIEEVADGDGPMPTRPLAGVGGLHNLPARAPRDVSAPPPDDAWLVT